MPVIIRMATTVIFLFGNENFIDNQTSGLQLLRVKYTGKTRCPEKMRQAGNFYLRKQFFNAECGDEKRLTHSLFPSRAGRKPGNNAA